MTYRKKLIEVALPLDAINKESAKEKSIRRGHPSTLHTWWARRPLASCRAVLFASLVDDPSEHPEEFPTEQTQQQERQRLFRLIEQLVKWENINNEDVLQRARVEIIKSTKGNSPAVFDPFAGGGSIPLEAQRLGLKAFASDLNPIAVLINKAQIEIPFRFAGHLPINKDSREYLMERDWVGAQALANDVRYYGKWMVNEAKKRIGHLYPKANLPKEYGGGSARVIAWLWSRTITCSNPACRVKMPLVRSFWLSKKKSKEAWVMPIVDNSVSPSVLRFKVMTGTGEPPSGTINRQGATCIACETPIPLSYVRSEAQQGRMNVTLLAIIVEGQREKLYVSPSIEHEQIAYSELPKWKPEELVTTPNHDVDRLPMYGMFTWGDAFTPRQLIALTTFSELVKEVREKILVDAKDAGLPIDGVSLNNGGIGATAHADAIATYLAFAVDRSANYWSSLTPWGGDFIVQTFGRQAIQMVWDFAEGNPFSDMTGNWIGAVQWIAQCLEVSIPASDSGEVRQCDAMSITDELLHPLISTDPPYYDNISYAVLSDFFYVWLRRSLRTIYPDLFTTVLVPKNQELIASSYRFNGDKKKAEQFFEVGLEKAFQRMRVIHNPDYPLTVFYAFKQAEVESDGESEKGDTKESVASTGWETMLEALLRSGFAITGTWPIRTERDQGLKTGTNVLASSIVLVCRPRPKDAPLASRREFLNALRAELPEALTNLQRGSIAPVDLAQASIGPGMAIYSRYSQVVESDGSLLRVRTALQLINRTLDEVLAEQEGEYDGETRWAIAWFDEYAHDAGEYGRAETLSKAKNISVQSLVEAGFLEAKGGKVRLLKREELPEEWHPKISMHLTVWEVMQRLIHALDKKGESAAGDILRQVGEHGEIARDLAYRLYTVCERKNWSPEARAYNSLVTSWSEINRLAQREASDNSLWGGTY